MTILLFARNLRSAHVHATSAGIPWNLREYISRPEQLRGRATKGVDRRFFGDWQRNANARAIADALYVSDLYTPEAEVP